MQIKNQEIKALLERKKSLSKDIVGIQKKVNKAQNELNKQTLERNKIAEELQKIKDELTPLINKEVELPEGEIVSSVDLKKGFVVLETTTLDKYIEDTKKLAEENARKAWAELEKRS